VNEKILIIEDNPLNMRLVEMVLKAKNYALLEAANGEQGLDVAIKERPDLIIMDIQLPKMNGLEVARKMRKYPALRHTPIIGVTAYAMKGDREKIIQAGCDKYMSKPIDTRELPKVIAEMLSRDNLKHTVVREDCDE